MGSHTEDTYRITQIKKGSGDPLYFLGIFFVILSSVFIVLLRESDPVYFFGLDFLGRLCRALSYLILGVGIIIAARLFTKTNKDMIMVILWGIVVIGTHNSTWKRIFTFFGF